MVLDISKIKTIDNAKNAQYGGSPIKDSEKVIFDKSELKKADGSTIDEVKLQAAAKLLDEVKRADKLTKRDEFLLNELVKAKNNNDDIYKAVNSVGTLVDSSITRLQGLSSDDEEQNQALKLATQKLAAARVKVKVKEEEETKLAKELEDFYKDTAYPHQAEVNKLERMKDAIAAKIGDLKKAGSIGEKILKNMLKINEDWVKVIDWGDQFHETKITDEKYVPKDKDGKIRKYVNSWSIGNASYFFVEAIQELDRGELKKSGISAKALAAYDNLKKSIFFHTYKDGKKDESHEGNWGKDFVSWDDYINTLEIKRIDGSFERDEEWYKFKLSDLFAFMDEVFPESSYSEGKVGDLLDKNKSKLNSATLEKEHFVNEMIFFSKNPKIVYSRTTVTAPDDPFGYIKSHKPKLKWADGTLTDFFYKIFHSKRGDGGKVKRAMDKRGNLVEVEVTEFERDYYGSRNANIWLYQTQKAYVEWAKETITNKITTAKGEEVKVNFEDDGWARAARKVADSAIRARRRLTEKNLAKSRKQIIQDFNNQAVEKGTRYHTDLSVRYLDEYTTDPWDELQASSEVKLGFAKAIVEDDAREVKEKTSKIVAIRAEVKKAKAEESVAKEEIDKARGTTLEGLKEEFDKIYGAGPSSKKYSWIELLKMESKLNWIALKEPTKVLDSKYAGYKSELDSKIQQKLIKLESDNFIYIKILKAGDSISESLKAIGYRSEEEKKEKLEGARDYLSELEKIRGLNPIEEAQKAQIKAILEGKDDDGGDKMKLPDLKDALKGTDANAKDATYHLSVWQGLSKFKKKDDVEKLIKLVCETTGAVKETFKDWLAANKVWGIDKIKKDDVASNHNQWETFIKREPKYVIGAIKLFEYEHVPAKKTEIDVKIDAANGDPKAEPTKGWNKSDKEHLGEFLYKVAIGETGDDLIKARKGQPIPPHQENGNGNKVPWYKAYGWMSIWLPLSIIAIAAILVYVFWENIMNWWNGPTEEGGEAEKIDEEEE